MLKHCFNANTALHCMAVTQSMAYKLKLLIYVTPKTSLKVLTEFLHLKPGTHSANELTVQFSLDGTWCATLPYDTIQ